MKKRIKKIIGITMLGLSGIIFALIIYFIIKFKNVSFEQLLYSLFYSEGSSFNAIKEGIVFGVIIFLVYIIIVLMPFFIKITIKNIKIFPLPYNFFFFYSIILFLLLFFCGSIYFGFFKYLYYQINTTDLFDNYVNPKNVDIVFREKKNLIYIYVESLEMGNVSVENGGLFSDSIIPNLEKLAVDNINFSNGSKLGGALQVDGVGWTMAGMVAQTSGIPLKLLIHGNHYDEYSSFLPGAYSLGEILAENGYHNYIMMGSDASFGGRKQYFQEHGNYEIFDYYWAIKQKLIVEQYYRWWGYEDSKLFQYAKDQLLNISKKGEPFNFSLLTADTHFPDGYIDKSCEGNLPFEQHYANSFYCSDNLLYQFIEWVMQQDFYKDTVIVIVGDHLVMQSDFYKNVDFKDRTVYNTIINSSVIDGNFYNRLFTTMDMYPTTLAAMGADIPGDRLGLGTNLFSSKKTLLEELGYDYFNSEITKKSSYYNNYILGDTYEEMYKNIGREYDD